MNTELAEKLCDLNNRFYRTWASSFSDTRHNIWPGWQRCLEEMKISAPNHEQAQKNRNAGADASNTSQTTHTASIGSVPQRIASKEYEGRIASTSAIDERSKELRLLDVACGNLRYEAFLARSLPACTITVLAIDACAELPSNSVTLPLNTTVNFERCDVIKELIAGNLSSALCTGEQADLTVSFGFMHHIPLPSWRRAFIKALIDATAPEGYLCLSFWRFLSNEGLALKASETTAKGIAELGIDEHLFEKGDCLLGWKNEPGAYRYCHSFSEKEIDTLIASVSEKAKVIARFRSDGRSGDMNEYLVLQKI